MSMLAERKRKERWHLFPLNNDWVRDTNKFGQKLLEKMGWTPGKGLGVKEQGITEAIRPKVNASQKGLGYKFDPSTVWLEHQGNFSSLLSELNSNNRINPDQSIQLSSLEEKSRNLKKRVHYHKFARGKDLSRCDQKDLSSIFGGVPHMITETKEIRIITNFSSRETAVEKNNQIGLSSVVENFTVKEVEETVSHSNKESGGRRGKNKTKSNYLGFVKDIEEPMDEVLSSVSDVLEVSCDALNEIGKNSYSLKDSESLKKKKKKRKILNDDDFVYSNTSSINGEVLQVDNSIYQNENSIINDDSLDFNASEVPTKKRKKSKKKIIIEQNSDDVIDDCSLKSCNNDGVVYSNTSSVSSEVLQVDNSIKQNGNSIINDDALDFNASEVPTKKRKKSKKKIIGEINSDDVIDDCLLKSCNNNGCESESDKKYKKRKKIK